MRMWDEISDNSSYCPSFLFCITTELGDISTFLKNPISQLPQEQWQDLGWNSPQGWSAHGTEQGKPCQGEFYLKVPTNHSSRGPLGRLGVGGQTHKSTPLAKPRLLHKAVWICKVPLRRVVMSFFVKLTDFRRCNGKQAFVSAFFMPPVTITTVKWALHYLASDMFIFSQGVEDLVLKQCSLFN